MRYATPDASQFGRGQAMFVRRRQLYQPAQLSNPERWTGITRSCIPRESVRLNPE